MKNKCLLLFSLLFSIGFAQAPVGYYNAANGLSGTALKSALHNIIKNHTSITYAGLWTAFDSTDTKANGEVWDMYSDIPGGTPPYVYHNPASRCGNYNGEADCFNREHSWPESWFNGLSPSYTDLFHIYPTDGWVNNKRGNYPYGEVSNPTWTSLNGGKLGPNTTTGYALTVFEPINEYKGDLARGYFYMTTRYMGEDSAWSTSDATNKSVIEPWAVCVLLKWHHQDTVSTKEINRNNAIYKIQNNRNPFVDHPEWVDSIFTCTLTSIKNIKEPQIKISVFPNPCSDKATVVFSENIAKATVHLYNYLGEEISRQQIENSKGL
ncbi:MAG TPA: endonuclease, partial [Bacteroidia bacterium]|nr:endonuclease [Bacteroidia bacterium]